MSAAKIIGETAGVERFGSRAAFARHNGTAPIPVWSGTKTRHRLNRGGNRQLNAALHRIAITQARLHRPARARDHGGSGLGLAIVAKLATAHNGTVTIGDATLGGARLEVTLPART